MTLTNYARNAGTVWPVVVTSTDDEDSPEWKLRHAPERLTRGEHLWLAAVVAAYSSLTDPHSVAPREKFARARRAARGWFYPQSLGTEGDA
jgi:hypothetical protein